MVQREITPRKVTRDELNSLIDKAADLIRTAVDYKFILVLLFLKRLNDLGKSERLQVKQRLMKETGLSEKDADQEADKFDYTFKIPKQFLWDEITRDVKNLPERLATAISEVAKLNKELQGVINRIDFLEFARNQENRELLRQLVELFNKYELNGELSPSILGDAYEHILMKFAPQKAKEGEIYTPREVIQLMVEILDPKPGESVYDPCCGSGGMLIISYMHVAEKYGKEDTGKLFLYGQERSPEIYAVGQMDLLLHGIQNANLANGDTLDYPRFRDDGKLKQFDIVIANPPWNQDGYGQERLKKSDFRERFGFGYSPQGNADWSWVQHMLASTKEDGKVAIVLDQGALSREGNELTIRSAVVEKDFIECIILLAEKLFYNTGAAGIIIVFNKNKSANRKGKILFVNATEEFGKHPSVRRLNTLTFENTEKIVREYMEFADVKGFARAVDLKQIRDNEYDLNVPLYAPLSKEETIVNLRQLHEDLRKIEMMNRKRTAKYLESILKLGGEDIFVEETGFKPTKIGRFPEKWDVEKLGEKENATIIMGQSPPSSTYNKKGVGLPFLQGNADFGDIYPKPQLYTSKPAKIAEKDDILISVRAPVGEINLAPFRCCIGRGLAAVRPNPKKLDFKFAFYYLKYMAKSFVGRGSTFKAIKKKDLVAFLFAIPPLPEQKRIAEILSNVDEEIAAKDLERDLFLKAKIGLMQNLLNGKIRVKVD